MRTHPAFVRLLHVLALILLSGLFVLGTGCVHDNDPWYDDPPPPRHHRQPPPPPHRAQPGKPAPPPHVSPRPEPRHGDNKPIPVHDPPRRQAGPSPAPLIPFAEAPRSFRIFRLRPRTGHGTGMAAAPHTACNKPCAHRQPLPGNALSGQGYFLP